MNDLDRLSLDLRLRLTRVQALRASVREYFVTLNAQIKMYPELFPKSKEEAVEGDIEYRKAQA